MRPGILARQTAAQLRSEKFTVGDEVRAARGIGLQLFDLRKRQADADQRVAAVRDRLQRIDVSALEAELADALAERAMIAEQIAALTAPARDEQFAELATG
ncbi:hypothetical protein IVB18_28050 [Bradyrhizobium sp. 186]|uniref:hypothetical protein n=1 Tax=Bradyrhizobium sp. 186 TaxID=2782654 RepID=UPI002000C7F2|nr:hypothetical protein [Bradyrhizobium sp. 186]UPK32146.1 hypothetical protein IVB18_28050 [Bradyrhizobium sp. 186]